MADVRNDMDQYALNAIFQQYQKQSRNHVFRTVEMLHQHIEMMAAAYLRETKIPPNEVALIHEVMDGGRVNQFYFVRRDEVDKIRYERRNS